MTGWNHIPLASQDNTQRSNEYVNYNQGQIPIPAEDAPLSEKFSNQPLARRLDESRIGVHTRLFFDVLIASLAFLFAVFGFLVYKYDKSSADLGTTGRKLFDIAKYAPTVFPVLFAAIVGGAFNAIASWRIQTCRGATLGFLEQCLGSQTLTRAFTTQINMRAFNLLSVFIILLWALSPLGSQASLRVISIETSYQSNQTHLVTMNTTQEYHYGFAEGMSEAKTSVAGPTVASILAASLLGPRNQDLWGNVRFPALEPLEKNGSSGWMQVPRNTNLTYSSLIGAPIVNLPSSGNISFTAPGSYLSISCPVFGLSPNQTKLTNFTAPGAPKPDNGFDCKWANARGGTQYQVAISMPCASFTAMNGTRNARELVWESLAGQVYTRAECKLTTTFVDANMTCTGSSSGTSTGSTCNCSAARRSVAPLFDGNWTVLDIDFQGDATSVLSILTNLFPDAEQSGGMQPVVTFITSPDSAVGSRFGGSYDVPTYAAGVSAFEIRLAQLLNTVLYLGIEPANFVGAFNGSSSFPQATINIPGTTTMQQDIVRYNGAWLGILILASLSAFIIAVVAAALRFLTLAPDVLGSLSVAFLQNKVVGISGSSTWSSTTWARQHRNRRLYLGDVQPESEVGRIALAASAQEGPLGAVQAGRYYE